MKMDSRRYFNIYCADQHNRVDVGVLISDKPFYQWTVLDKHAHTEVQNIQEVGPDDQKTYRDRIVYQCPAAGCRQRVPVNSRDLIPVVNMGFNRGLRELSLSALPTVVADLERTVAESSLRAQAKSGLPDELLLQSWSQSPAGRKLTERERRAVWEAFRKSNDRSC